MMVVLHSLQIIGACNVGDADSEILSGRAVNGKYGWFELKPAERERARG
jgi:hypothetical protein